MSKFDELSRCCSGNSVKFRWYGFPKSKDGQDIEAVLQKFQLLIEGSSRITNGYVWSMARAEIKSRIKIAEAGKLRTTRQIKPVDVNNPPPLYEIRWQDITVQERIEDGTIRDSRLLVRMYHSEPREAPGYFIGHHIHEKDVTDTNQVNNHQNAEIGVALKYFDNGRDDLWGISELTKDRKNIN